MCYQALYTLTLQPPPHTHTTHTKDLTERTGVASEDRTNVAYVLGLGFKVFRVWGGEQGPDQRGICYHAPYTLTLQPPYTLTLQPPFPLTPYPPRPHRHRRIRRSERGRPAGPTSCPPPAPCLPCRCLGLGLWV